MTVLAVETSCDETSVAVVRDGVLLSNVVSSQTALHAEYGGVVPELASREHLRNFLPVAREAIARAQITGVDAVAATRGPGLPAALLIGLKAAQSLAFVWRKPFVAVHHHEAHLYSPWLSGEPLQARFDLFQPNVSLIVSGGHTLLVRVDRELQHEVLGSTVDDAAGECFDKIGKLIGLAYPGGPEIDRLATNGDGSVYDFPRPMIHDATHDFSFAGLKTSVRYFIQRNPKVLADPSSVANLCASVQAAIVDVLVTKTIRAAKRAGVGCVTASGGVSCNRRLREDLAKACQRDKLKLMLAERILTTDNAAMVAMLAERKLLNGLPPASYDTEIEPSWALETTQP